MVLFNNKVERPAKITTLNVSHQQQIRPIFCGAQRYWWKTVMTLEMGVNN
jgi:hypothetical protein